MFLRKTSRKLTRILSHDKLNATLTSLEKFTKYCIRLAGFTRRGVGNRSRCINVMTDEDGELISFPNASVLLIIRLMMSNIFLYRMFYSASWYIFLVCFLEE